MNTGKLFKAFVAITALVSLCLAVYSIVSLKTITNNMSVQNIAALQVECPEGTPISSWNWGTFNEVGQVKQTTFTLRNVGNTQLNCNVTIENLPDGWTISLSRSDWTIAPGASTNLTISLRLDEALPVGDYSFSLNFYIP